MKTFNQSILIISAISLLYLSIVACDQRRAVEVNTAAEKVINSDSIPVIPQTDSLILDPQTQETALQQDPTSAEKPAQPFKEKTCSPGFNALAKPTGSLHFFYVSGFNAGQFICWKALETHGTEICGDQNCVIYYFDDAKISATNSPPHYVSEQTLMNHGIGRFEFNGHYWELKGSKIWKREGTQFAYYNTNNNAGG